MSHTITIKFDELGWPPDYSMICTEPIESLCHADWECSCDVFGEAGDENGRPWHESCYGDGEVHYGTYDSARCNIRDWFENTEDVYACIKGRTSFEVDPEWEGEWFNYRIVESAPAAGGV